MRHISVPASAACEILSFTPVNPLIAKCDIKVCYVSDTPNRNQSLITKDVAMEMAKSLPGCPIVGYYNDKTEDFEEHNRIIDISNNQFEIKDMTRPYGFVSMDAKVWFQKFLDDGVEHEYLCTEGYVWNKIYPESQRIIDSGNNQSMELFDESVKGSWAIQDNGLPDFFIINEALISKLCILGENVEPCFEGASIKQHYSFTLDDTFKQQMFTMMNELKEVLNKGGTFTMNENEKLEQQPAVETPVDTDFKKKEEEEKKKEQPKEEEKKSGSSDSENTDKSEEKKNEKDNSEDKGEDNKDKKNPFEKDSDEDEKKKKKYSLEEIPEYVELNKQFAQVQKELSDLQTEIASLREFKAVADRKAKQEMIDGFYMLSDEDKKDCVDNIDKYSLHDIEANLSIICFRNKVNFNLDNEKSDNQSEPTTFALDNHDDNDTAPAWIKAVRNTAKNM